MSDEEGTIKFKVYVFKGGRLEHSARGKIVPIRGKKEISAKAVMFNNWDEVPTLMRELLESEYTKTWDASSHYWEYVRKKESKSNEVDDAKWLMDEPMSARARAVKTELEFESDSAKRQRNSA